MSATRAPTLAQDAPKSLGRAKGAASRVGAPVAKPGAPFGPSILATDSGHRPGVARFAALRLRMVTHSAAAGFLAIRASVRAPNVRGTSGTSS